MACFLENALVSWIELGHSNERLLWFCFSCWSLSSPGQVAFPHEPMCLLCSFMYLFSFLTTSHFSWLSLKGLHCLWGTNYLLVSRPYPFNTAPCLSWICSAYAQHSPFLPVFLRDLSSVRFSSFSQMTYQSWVIFLLTTMLWFEIPFGIYVFACFFWHPLRVLRACGRHGLLLVFLKST